MSPPSTKSGPESAPGDLARYARQIPLKSIGEEGQRRLGRGRVTLIGCGALGSVLGNTLVRAGVGHLQIVDRDYIELDNLQRQVLFDEQDIADNLPKAEAAARKLRRVNSAVAVEPVVADFNPGNAEALCRDADLLLDGTDNLETRFLINDVAVKLDLPWVYGACIAAEGLVMPIVPHDTPCLRCIWEEPPPPGTLPTCETAGVLGPVVNIVASRQAIEALKLLLGRRDELNRRLVTIDAWSGRVRQVDFQTAYDQGDCRCCRQGQFDFLAGGRVTASATLCGRDAVQVLPPPASGSVQPPSPAVPTAQVDFRTIAGRLGPQARPRYNAYILRFTVNDYEITLFCDGRAIVKGTSDPAIAKSVYARYIGL